MGDEGVGKTRLLDDLAAVVAGAARLARPRRAEARPPQVRRDAAGARTGVHARLRRRGRTKRAPRRRARARLPRAGHPRAPRRAARDARRRVRRVRLGRGQKAAPHGRRAPAGRRRVAPRPGRRRTRAAPARRARRARPRLGVAGPLSARAPAARDRHRRPSGRCRRAAACARLSPRSGRSRSGRSETRTTAALFEYFVSRYGVACADVRHYRREVLRRTEGNPAILRAMMHDGAQSHARDRAGRARPPGARRRAVFQPRPDLRLLPHRASARARVFMIGVRRTPTSRSCSRSSRSSATSSSASSGCCSCSRPDPSPNDRSPHVPSGGAIADTESLRLGPRSARPRRAPTRRFGT